MDDGELLREYTQLRSEQAFTELVRRHLAMVYSTARRLVRNEHLAQDVSQAVFLVLAQRASRLTRAGSLAGWLYRVTCYAATRAVAADQRRQHHEQRAGLERPAMQPEDVEQVWAEQR